MKHARKDYDRIQDPAGLIPEDEPVFLLRAQDRFAPDTVNFWARQTRQVAVTNSDPDLLKISEIAAKHAIAMANWQKHHKVKLPDLPTEIEEKKASDGYFEIPDEKIEAAIRKAVNGMLIVKANSFEEFSKIWLADTCPTVPNYISSTPHSNSLNFQSDKIFIRKGIGVSKVIFVIKEKLSLTGIVVDTSIAYRKEHYDDVLDVLVKDGDPLEININE